jgi:hypothetical protein
MSVRAQKKEPVNIAIFPANLSRKIKLNIQINCLRSFLSLRSYGLIQPDNLWFILVIQAK